MKRLLPVIAISVLGLGLVACQSASPQPGADEVSTWLQGQTAADRPDALAAMSGGATVDSERSDEGTGIAVDFESEERVTGIEFSCFGEEKMSVAVELRGATQTRSDGTDDLVCADSPHMLPDPFEGAIRVSAVGMSERGVGAWSVVVLGQTQ